MGGARLRYGEIEWLNAWDEIAWVGYVEKRREGGRGFTVFGSDCFSYVTRWDDWGISRAAVLSCVVWHSVA